MPEALLTKLIMLMPPHKCFPDRKEFNEKVIEILKESFLSYGEEDSDMYRTWKDTHEALLLCILRGYSIEYAFDRFSVLDEVLLKDIFKHESN